MLRKLTKAKSVKPPIPRKPEVYIPLNIKEGSNCSWEGTLTQ